MPNFNIIVQLTFSKCVQTPDAFGLKNPIFEKSMQEDHGGDGRYESLQSFALVLVCGYTER